VVPKGLIKLNLKISNHADVSESEKVEEIYFMNNFIVNRKRA